MEVRKQIPVETTEDDTRRVWLVQDAYVLIEPDSLRKRGGRFLPKSSAADELFLVETFRPNYRRRLRATTRMQLRWHADLMVSSYEWIGKADDRCRRCRHMLGWFGRGCSKHVKWTRVERPDPNAGKVFAQLSLLKVYGLKEDTRILFQENGTWLQGKILAYPLWREQELAAERVVQKARYKKRRHDRLPTVWERLLGDHLGLGDD